MVWALVFMVRRFRVKPAPGVGKELRMDIDMVFAMVDGV